MVYFRKSIQDCLAYRQEQMAYFEAVFTALHNNKPIVLGETERLAVNL